MKRPDRISMAEAMRTRADSAGWRPMSCAPRVSRDDDDVPPIILAMTEDDSILEAAWNPSANAWCSGSDYTKITSRLIAWRPVAQFNAPSERTMALSLADDCEARAAQHDRLAPFIPVEKEHAAKLRIERDKYLAVAGPNPS